MTSGAVMDRNTGWLHLLPLMPEGARVLCVDTDARNTAASLAYFMDSPVSRHVVYAGDARLPAARGDYDLLLCRVIGAAWFPDKAGTLLDECARVLAPDGVLYLDAGDVPWTAKPTLRREILAGLQRRGLVHQRSWAALCDRGFLSEILPAAGYQSSRNSWRVSESAKELLFGPGAPWLAPAQVVIASRAALRAPALEQLDPQGAGGSFARYIVNPAKSFYQPRESPARLYVLPGDVQTVERRRTEFAVLERLASSGLDIAALLPGARRETRFRERPAFVMQAFDGVTVDLPVPQMPRLFDAAYEILVRFNEQSVRVVPVQGALLESVVDRAARSAMGRYPEAATALEQLRQALLASLGDGTRAVVWSHGDYKLENLVFDRQSRAVQAVIDWELACDAGLPMVDLLYLIGYREITLGHCSDMLELLLRGEPAGWSPLASRYLERYMARFRLTARHAAEALAVLLLHHVGLRYTYAADDREAMDSISRAAYAMRCVLSN